MACGVHPAITPWAHFRPSVFISLSRSTPAGPPREPREEDTADDATARTHVPGCRGSGSAWSSTRHPPTLLGIGLERKLECSSGTRKSRGNPGSRGFSVEGRRYAKTLVRTKMLKRLLLPTPPRKLKNRRKHVPMALNHHRRWRGGDGFATPAVESNSQGVKRQ